MQLPRDLLIFALPSIPGRRRQAWLLGRTIFGSVRGFAVYAVELVYDFFTLFDHRHLVFTNRYACGTESGDVSGLADRIAEEPNRDAGFEVSHLDLSFYSRVTLHTDTVTRFI